MVVKLTGIIEGQNVVFERTNGDVWQATIPATLNGAFAVELTAIDAEGNVAHIAKYIVTIDMDALYVHVELCTYSEELLPFEYDSTCEVSNYYAEVEENAIGSVFEVSNFIPKVYVSDYYARLEEENEDC